MPRKRQTPREIKTECKALVESISKDARFICIDEKPVARDLRLIFEYGGKVWDIQYRSLKNGLRPWRTSNKKGQPIIYKFYKGDTLLYIGKTTDQGYRFCQHKSRTSWIQEVDKVEILYPKNEADMHILEPYLINKYNPKYNIEFVTESAPTFEIKEPHSYIATEFLWS